ISAPVTGLSNDLMLPSGSRMDGILTSEVPQSKGRGGAVNLLIPLPHATRGGGGGGGAPTRTPPPGWRGLSGGTAPTPPSPTRCVGEGEEDVTTAAALRRRRRGGWCFRRRRR